VNIEEIREYYKDLPDGKLQEIAKNEIHDLSEDARIVLTEELERRKIIENAFMATAQIVNKEQTTNRETIKMEDGLRPPVSEPAQNTISEQQSAFPIWEEKGPFFRRLWNTWVVTIFHPKTFFSKIPTDAGIGKAFLYALIVGFIGWVFYFCSLSFLIVAFGGRFNFELAFIGAAVLYAISTPFIWSTILELFLFFVNGNNRGFKATYRTVAYSTSIYLFFIIPFAGWVLCPILQLIFIIIGIKVTQQISTIKAIVAVILSLIFCYGCSVALRLLESPAL